METHKYGLKERLCVHKSVAQIEDPLVSNELSPRETWRIPGVSIQQELFLQPFFNSGHSRSPGHYWAKHLNSEHPNSQVPKDSNTQNCPACKGQASWYTDLVGPRPLAGTRPWHTLPPLQSGSPLGFLLLKKCSQSADGKFAKNRLGNLLQLSEWRGCWRGPRTTHHAVLLSAHGIEMRGFWLWWGSHLRCWPRLLVHQNRTGITEAAESKDTTTRQSLTAHKYTQRRSS